MNQKDKKFEKLDRSKKKKDKAVEEKEKTEEKKTKKEKEQNDDLQLKDDVHALVSVLRDQRFHEFVRHLRSPWRIMWTNFLAGIFRGLGILVGLTMVIGLLVWLVTQLINFPLIGQYFAIVFEWIRDILPPEILSQFENLQQKPDIY